MNLSLIGVELARLLVYLAVSYFLFSYILQITLQQEGPAIAKAVLSMDTKHLQQLQSVDKRVSKTAQQKIATDLMENSPLAPVLSVLTEETRAYLAEHPEALPDVLQSYAGTIDVGLKMLPEIQKYIPGLAQLKLGKPAEKVDY